MLSSVVVGEEAMNQLALLPLDTIETKDAAAPGRLVSIPGRARQAPRTAVGAPGFLSVRAAAERLGLQPRSVRYLIEHGLLRSRRLGGMHFTPGSQVDASRRPRRARARRSQHALA